MAAGHKNVIICFENILFLSDQILYIYGIVALRTCFSYQEMECKFVVIKENVKRVRIAPCLLYNIFLYTSQSARKPYKHL